IAAAGYRIVEVGPGCPASTAGRLLGLSTSPLAFLGVGLAARRGSPRGPADLLAATLQLNSRGLRQGAVTRRISCRGRSAGILRGLDCTAVFAASCYRRAARRMAV